MEICRICLTLDTKVYKLGNGEAKYFIENIFIQNGFEQELQETHFICFECKALLDKSHKFIKRALIAQKILFDMLKGQNAITFESLKQVDRTETGFKLVKDLKYIDFYFDEEDNNILNNIKNDQCNLKLNNADTKDPLESLSNYVKEFGTDILSTDCFETNLDAKDFIDNVSKEEKLDVSFDNLQDVIYYEFDETALVEKVKDEILEENCNKFINTKKNKQPSKALKNSNKSNLIRASTKTLKGKAKLRKRRILAHENCVELDEYNGTEDLNGPPKLNAPDYPIKCEHCSYEVPDRLTHFHHYQWEHKDKKYPYGGNTGKIFICKFCGHVSKSKYAHVDHEWTHGNVHNFTCPQCPKTFVNRTKLHKHIYRTHPSQMLECDFCGKKVKSRGSIMIHMRIHTGERPFKCPICGAGFAHRGNIRPHIRANHDQCDQSSLKLNKKKKTCGK